jgi:hypothetical protein
MQCINMSFHGETGQTSDGQSASEGIGSAGSRTFVMGHVEFIVDNGANPSQRLAMDPFVQRSRR